MVARTSGKGSAESPQSQGTATRLQPVEGDPNHPGPETRVTGPSVEDGQSLSVASSMMITIPRPKNAEVLMRALFDGVLNVRTPHSP